MQPLNTKPRQHLSDDQVRELLTGARIEVVAGCELVDVNNKTTEDLGADFDGGKIEYDNYADVHGICTLHFTRRLDWGRQRVRPYMKLSNNGVTARFNLGVYVLTTPETPRGESPLTWEVEGYNLLQQLVTNGPGDTYWVSSGTKYLTAVTNVLTAAGVSAPLQMDGSRQDTTLPDPMVWALTQTGGATWLEIINDLLAAIGYKKLWANHEGTFRSGPHIEPLNRAVEWTFNTHDRLTNIVGEQRKMVQEAFDIPNWWRFVRADMGTKPVEGSGIYTVTNQSSGPTSIDSIGRTVRRVEFLDVADQEALVAQGKEIVAADKQRTRRFEILVDPLPIAGHDDVVQLIDAGRDDKCRVASWELPLDGSQGTWVLEMIE